MASVKYVGNSAQVEWHGHLFERNKAVDDISDVVASQFSGNPFFEVVGADRPGVQYGTASRPFFDDEPGTIDPLKAEHRGRGRYSIMRGDEEVKEGLTKADADTFNALSDDEKAAYVADED